MSSAIESQGTKLEIAGDAGGAVSTVTATVGYPTIITKASHGLDNGDVVTTSAFAGADAALINGLDLVVKNVTTNTLALDVDTTGKTLTASNGTLTPKTWTEVGEINDFDGPSGSASVIDVTHLQSTAKEKRMGLADEGQFSFSINKIFSDTGQAALVAARAARSIQTFRVTYSDTSTQTFNGYVLGFATSGSVDGKVGGKVTIEITGAVTEA